MIQLVVQELEPEWDVIVPVTREGYQPLCAVYSKRCLKVIEEQFKKGDMKISKLFSKVKVRKIAEETLKQIDPDLISFFNINNQTDLTLFKKMRSSLAEGYSSSRALIALKSLSPGEQGGNNQGQLWDFSTPRKKSNSF